MVLISVGIAFSASGQMAVPKLTGRVVDSANLLSADDRQQLTAVLQKFEEATKGQMAILIIPKLEKDAIESFSIRVADAWKLGDRDRDDGVLLTISVGDAKTRLEVGQGFEGVITDGRAGDILRELAPYFREKRFKDGLIMAVNQTAVFITGAGLANVNVAPVRQSRNGSSRSSGWVYLFIFFFLILRIFSGRTGMYYGGHYRGGGGFSGGGFSGGGGGFSGGGASGGW